MQTAFNVGLNYAWGDGEGTITKIVEKNGQAVDEEGKMDLSLRTFSLVISSSYRFD